MYFICSFFKFDLLFNFDYSKPINVNNKPKSRTKSR